MSQREVVFLPLEQSAVVIAPPGHGKTFVMARRIAYLLQDNLVPAPGRILGLTFTNAAAREMMERVRSYLGPVDRVDITTFHSFAYQVLRAYGNLLGIDRKFTVLSARRSEELVTQALQEAYPDWDDLEGNDRHRLLEAFAEWRQEHILRLNDEYVHPSLDGVFTEALRRLRDWMERESALDYDHVLWYARRLLQERPSVLRLLRSTYRCILVDEFQDTNPLQFAILRLLCGGSDGAEDRRTYTPVLILADPKQAIYEFQGAVPANVHCAIKVFECGNPIKLRKNYRTQSPFIRALSTALREPQNADYDTRLGKIPLYIAPDPCTEAEWIVNQVQELINSGVPHDEVAVIARIGGRLDQVRAHLEVRGLPAVFVPDFRSNDIECRYASLFDRLGEIVEAHLETRRRASLKSEFRRLCTEIGLDLQEDDIVRTMYEVAATYDSIENYRVPLWEKVQSFLNEILLEINWGEVIRKAVKGKVFVSSIHGVKGLQFETVIICGLENFCFPTRFTCWPCIRQGHQSVVQKLDQEYRVLYVGITRAISEIYLYASLTGGRNLGPRQVSCLVGRIARFIALQGSDMILNDYLCDHG